MVHLTESQIGEALKRLRRMVPVGPKDEVNIEDTIRATTKNAGEIEIVFDRSLRDRLKVILMIDNGGWSMDPYVDLVQTLFNYARSQFKDLKTFYFHNTDLRFRVGGSAAAVQTTADIGFCDLGPRNETGYCGRRKYGPLRVDGDRRIDLH